jgi:double zinc ribbon protein
VAELEQFFRVLVQTLAGQNPARLHQPLAIGEVSRVLPYREARRHLALNSVEEYETLLIRLCAGEGGFAQADSATQQEFAAEVQRPLPDLDVIRRKSDSHLVLRTEPMAEALNGGAEERYAPREAGKRESGEAGQGESGSAGQGNSSSDPLTRPPADPLASPEGASPLEFVVEHPAVIRCAFCGGILPATRQVNFCPHCGMGQDVGKCGKCGADVDVGWRYCVTCGEELHGVTS